MRHKKRGGATQTQPPCEVLTPPPAHGPLRPECPRASPQRRRNSPQRRAARNARRFAAVSAPLRWLLTSSRLAKLLKPHDAHAQLQNTQAEMAARESTKRC